ncbi:MAG: antibiotic biosynthesis monooxygenase [Clostridiaceae bacterium]|jgi:heme-degrading monooxygenase HmoA|nr:antibiotic biosynthesis monooxygenase [Clostridiaceae bacterium]
MVVVIFEVEIKEAFMDQYLSLAAGLKDQLQSADGFIRAERFTSLAKEGKLLSLSVWENEEAVSRWRQLADHRRCQQQGRETMFKKYQITVASKLRTYSMDERDEAPQDSNEFFAK